MHGYIKKLYVSVNILKWEREYFFRYYEILVCEIITAKIYNSEKMCFCIYDHKILFILMLIKVCCQSLIYFSGNIQ